MSPGLNILLRNGLHDATRDYLRRVQDEGSELGPNLRAVDTLIRGLIDDGLWPKIKAACLLAGPSNLSGALVPLRADMPSPENFNFVDADHNRAAGLKGAAPKYLDLNLGGLSLPQDDAHFSCFLTEAHEGAGVGVYIGNATASVAAGALILARSGVIPGNLALQIHGGTVASRSGGASVGLLALTRSSAGLFEVRNGGVSASLAGASSAPLDRSVLAYTVSGGGSFFCTGRQAWVSAGNNLSKSALDARLSTYMAALV